jgi:archaeal preflagellin peptidase FlaK
LDYILVRILVVLIMLGTSAYFDLRSRYVSDRVWIIFGVVAFIIYIIDPPVEEQIPYIILSVVFTTGLSGVAYKIGLFGGADVFALILVSVLVPINASYYFHAVGSPVLQSPIISLAILLNALVLSMSQLIINILYNLHYLQRASNRLFEGFEHETGLRKLLAVVIGQKKTQGSAKYGFSIEKSISGTKYFDFSLKNAEKRDFVSENESVWISSAMPFLVYVFAGFILTVIGIDIMALLSHLVSLI